jgi:hypothetical protein
MTLSVCESTVRRIEGWQMNWEGLERKRSWPNRDIIPELAWKDLGKSETPPLGYSMFRPRLEPSTSRMQVWCLIAKQIRSLSCISKDISTRFWRLGKHWMEGLKFTNYVVLFRAIVTGYRLKTCFMFLVALRPAETGTCLMCALAPLGSILSCRWQARNRLARKASLIVENVLT